MQTGKLTKILVVEDEPLIRMDLAVTLQEMGFSILEASNADEAIRLLEANDGIAAVVTDVDMPGTMDGFALAFAVRRRWPPCRLIVVSGHRRPAAGDMPDGSRFIRKPFATIDLQRTLSDRVGMTEAVGGSGATECVGFQFGGIQQRVETLFERFRPFTAGVHEYRLVQPGFALVHGDKGIPQVDEVAECADVGNKFLRLSTLAIGGNADALFGDGLPAFLLEADDVTPIQIVQFGRTHPGSQRDVDEAVEHQPLVFDAVLELGFLLP